jgi:hypothetical protein
VIPASWVNLYSHVTRLAEMRAGQFFCPAHRARPSVLRAAHLWGLMPGAQNLRMATLTISLCCPFYKPPAGLPAPTEEELLKPGGLAAAALPPVMMHPPFEFYNEFDTDGLREPYTFSYGETLGGVEGLDFAPVVRRAEELAALYGAFREGGSVEFLRRQWFSVADAKLAVALLYFQMIQL